MNHLRPENVCPRPLIDELLRCYRIDKDWVKLVPHDEVFFKTKIGVRTWLSDAIADGTGAVSMHALSVWYGEGPKIFRPTPQQQEALSHVDVRLRLSEYRQPFPAIFCAEIECRLCIETIAAEGDDFGGYLNTHRPCTRESACLKRVLCGFARRVAHFPKRCTARHLRLSRRVKALSSGERLSVTLSTPFLITASS